MALEFTREELNKYGMLKDKKPAKNKHKWHYFELGFMPWLSMTLFYFMYFWLFYFEAQTKMAVLWFGICIGITTYLFVIEKIIGYENITHTRLHS